MATLSFRKSAWFLVRGLFCALCCFALMASPANAAYPVRVPLEGGRTLEMARKPHRIVVLGPTLYAYMLVDLGAASRVVGLAHSADNPRELHAVPSVGQSLSPDLERIVSLSPDLVVGGTDAVFAQLSALSIACFTLGPQKQSLTGSQDVFSLLRVLALLVDGDTQAAERLIQKTQTEMSQVETALAAQKKETVAVLYAGPRGNLFAAGAETPEHELISRSAGQNVFSHLRRHKPVSAEELLRLQPGVILIDENQRAYLTVQPALHHLSALSRGRVFGINSAVHGSSRLGQALKMYASRIHSRPF
ncbi:MAG TPA: ABC transporter substrate-binding protein [Pseudomonadota bacterium]|jgi:ABC-type hemin transport system substrate-binding protein|nr:ABC transporter substrate-binding protein [Pseudomonadota bacterium]